MRDPPRTREDANAGGVGSGEDEEAREKSTPQAKKPRRILAPLLPENPQKADGNDGKKNRSNERSEAETDSRKKARLRPPASDEKKKAEREGEERHGFREDRLFVERAPRPEDEKDERSDRRERRPKARAYSPKKNERSEKREARLEEGDGADVAEDAEKGTKKDRIPEGASEPRMERPRLLEINRAVPEEKVRMRIEKVPRDLERDRENDRGRA